MILIILKANKLKPAQRDIFTSTSMIWCFDFVFVGRFEGLRDLPVGQDPGSPFGRKRFQSGPHILVIFSETKTATDKPNSHLNSS